MLWVDPLSSVTSTSTYVVSPVEGTRLLFYLFSLLSWTPHLTFKRSYGKEVIPCECTQDLTFLSIKVPYFFSDRLSKIYPTDCPPRMTTTYTKSALLSPSVSRWVEGVIVQSRIRPKESEFKRRGLPGGEEGEKIVVTKVSRNPLPFKRFVRMSG